MSVINQLPQHVANQIAAGEVVQRPASIVKELLENSIDAGAMSITLICEDGGRTLIQVIDDGVGMDAEDALKAFQRHATSKISVADDLFNLHTFGFRGEALASIASVSETQMSTKRAQDALGTQININGGALVSQVPVSTPTGTNIAVRNLFFNTPARRKFLKSVASENKQVMLEVQRVAMVNPDVEFHIVLDNKAPLRLSGTNLHQRITALTSKTLGSKLLSIESDTPIARISGYIGNAEAARKQAGDQYFFVNGRFMRNPYLQKAVVNGYGKLLTADQYPTFFIYIEVEPSKLDVNIHPTKSEVKFEEEHAIWQLISSSVRQTLGKHNIVPSLDFDNPTPVDIPTYNSSEEGYAIPTLSLKQDYNPFKSYDTSSWESPSKSAVWGNDPERAPFVEQIPDYLKFDKDSQPIFEMDKMAKNSEQSEQQFHESAPTEQPELPMDIETSFNWLQWGGRYIATTTADGILLIDYPRAMQRIAYEKMLRSDHFSSTSESELHPQIVELSPLEHRLLIDSEDEVADLGFVISNMGGTTVALQAMPSELTGKVSAEEAIAALIEGLESPNAKQSRKQTLASLVTRNISRTTPKILGPTEVRVLINDLLATEEPSFTPDGLPVIEVLNPKEIFNK